MDRLRGRINNLLGYKIANDSSSNSVQEILGTRTIYFNPVDDTHYVDNKISTGKYNFLTFLPLFLFEQFRKAFNVFFLFICILQQIPGVSPTGRYTTIVPLAFILLVAAIKEIIEDYKRHRQDDAVNNRIVEVFREGRFMQVKWTQVVVGDVVRVVNGKFFPADLVLLSSSEPEGMCYIETANLDGETNLKIRQGLPLTAKVCSSEDLMTTCGRIECEGPNRHLYEFNGNITLIDDNDRCVPLTNDQMLLRGAMLRNTQWVYGVAVYTGHESKLMKNANRAPLKMSNVDRTTNMQIWFIFIILMVISLGSAVGSEVWKMSKNRWYLSDNGPGVRGFFLELLTFIILYNNLVPISLLVTLEVVKFIQAIFINCDIDMYYEPTDTPAMARTSNLNEELGQVKYIFSDKTGTLTQNHMVFKKCSVAGVKYGNAAIDQPGFHDPKFAENLRDTNSKGKHLREFANIMSVCHTVVPDRKEKVTNIWSSNRDEFLSDEDGHQYDNIEYQSSSPDETALVTAAKNFGVVFVGRTPTHVTINVLGKEESYEILNVLEFTSLRKRMSVIVRTPDGAIKLLCKGADNVVYERLAADSQFQVETNHHLEEFAKEGLRTLCLAYTYLDEDKYDDWNKNHYQPASTAVHGRDMALAESYELIEKDLYLVGASAIEDRLQDGVPETISTLAKAGIKLWVLTGDKQETAINIAYSCHLFTQDMSLVILDDPSTDATRDKINEALSQIGSDFLRQENDMALIVNGAALKQATSYELSSSFLDLALSCKSVVCCRVSPIQKAEIVDLVKTHCKTITLAIGDGANDVSMIQAAHVGVGISGCEGLQAANSSDYSIAQLWFAFYNGFSGQILFDRWTIAFYNVFFTSLPPFVLGIFERTCSSANMLRYPQLYSLSQGAVKYNAIVFWKMFLNATVHSLMLFFMPVFALEFGIAFASGKTGGYLFLGNFVYTYCVVTVCLKAAMESSTWTVFTHIAIWGSIVIWFLFFVVYSYIFPALPVGEDMVGMANNVLACAIFWFGLILIPITVLFRDLLWKVLRRKFLKSVVEEVEELELLHIDPTETISEAATRQSLTEKAELLKNTFGNSDHGAISLTPNRNRAESALSQESGHGYAFSQEEGGAVSQAQLIRHYDSSASKPTGT